jgi:hypothetical protein
VESRTHLSVAPSEPIDEGDWTAGHEVRITVPARCQARYAFAVTADSKLSAVVKGAATSIRLQDATGDVAYAGPRAVSGVVPAGAYTLVVDDDGGVGSALVARAVPTRGAATLFPPAGTSRVAGYTVTAAAPATDLADRLGTFTGRDSARFAGTVAAEQHYAFDVVAGAGVSRDHLTLMLRSPDLSSLRVTLSGQQYPAGAGTIHETVDTFSDATTFALIITNIGDPGQAVPFRLSVATTPIVPPPVHLRGDGGGYSINFGNNPIPADPTDGSLATGLPAALVGDHTGWQLGFPTATADQWTFAADGTGLRTVGPSAGTVSVPFDWTFSQGQLALTFANGTVESADSETDAATGELAWLNVVAADGTAVGHLHPA